MHPPAGYPYQGPQSNQPYPQFPSPQYPGQPAPMPPWHDPSTGPYPPKPGSQGTTKYLLIIAGILGAMVVLGGIFLFSGDTGGHFHSGAEVTPTADRHIVYVKEKQLGGQSPSSVNCTGTTNVGAPLKLSPPSKVQTTTRNRRPKVRYVSVAELPTNRGPLKVTCTRSGSTSNLDLLLAQASSSPNRLMAVVGYLAGVAVLVAVILLVRHRYFRRHPRLRGDEQRWQP